MAKAPRPGVGARKEANEAAKRSVRITYDGEERVLALDNIEIGIKYQVLMETDRSWEDWRRLLGRNSLFAVEVMWWVAGLCGGKNERWPAVMGVFHEIDLDDVDITPVEDDEESEDPQS